MSLNKNPSNQVDNLQYDIKLMHLIGDKSERTQSAKEVEEWLKKLSEHLVSECTHQ